jgi:hypothetical protein
MLPTAELLTSNASSCALYRAPTLARPNAILYNLPINTPLY